MRAVSPSYKINEKMKIKKIKMKHLIDDDDDGTHQSSSSSSSPLLSSSPLST